MPVYEYRCKDCGCQFDKHQSFTEARLTDCPECGTGGSLRKVFGNVGVTFKGSGFYSTDSRSSGSTALSANGSKNGEAPKNGDTKSDGAKSESKPDSKQAVKQPVKSESKSASTSSSKAA